jgi:hypothetical protein
MRSSVVACSFGDNYASKLQRLGGTFADFRAGTRCANPSIFNWLGDFERALSENFRERPKEFSAAL